AGGAPIREIADEEHRSEVQTECDVEEELVGHLCPFRGSEAARCVSTLSQETVSYQTTCAECDVGRPRSGSVMEEAQSRRDEGDAVLGGGCGDLVGSRRSARLDDGADAELGCVVDVVAERQESVRDERDLVQPLSPLLAPDGV